MYVFIDKELIVSMFELKCDIEFVGFDDDFVSFVLELRIVSSLSCDFGISDVIFFEIKKMVKSKKIEEFLIRGEKGYNLVNWDFGNW